MTSRSKTHTHPCENSPRCPNTFACSGQWEPNHDGWPEAICDNYHMPNGSIDAVTCAFCEADTCVVCERVVGLDGHGDDCSQGA
jgi:hypothetical protein